MAAVRGRGASLGLRLAIRMGSQNLQGRTHTQSDVGLRDGSASTDGEDEAVRRWSGVTCLTSFSALPSAASSSRRCVCARQGSWYGDGGVRSVVQQRRMLIWADGQEAFPGARAQQHRPNCPEIAMHQSPGRYDLARLAGRRAFFLYPFANRSLLDTAGLSVTGEWI